MRKMYTKNKIKNKTAELVDKLMAFYFGAGLLQNRCEHYLNGLRRLRGPPRVTRFPPHQIFNEGRNRLIRLYEVY